MGTNSNTTGTNQGSGQHDASTTIGVGGATSGQAGATPAHETQAETGGSGGEQLTHSHGEIEGQRPAPQPSHKQAQPVESAVQSGARGALDTRAEQGGGTGTGLGSPETGANQSQDDLPPR